MMAVVHHTVLYEWIICTSPNENGIWFVCLSNGRSGTRWTSARKKKLIRHYTSEPFVYINNNYQAASRMYKNVKMMCFFIVEKKNLWHNQHILTVLHHFSHFFFLLISISFPFTCKLSQYSIVIQSMIDQLSGKLNMHAKHNKNKQQQNKNNKCIGYHQITHIRRQRHRKSSAQARVTQKKNDNFSRMKFTNKITRITNDCKIVIRLVYLPLLIMLDFIVIIIIITILIVP